MNEIFPRWRPPRHSQNSCVLFSDGPQWVDGDLLPSGMGATPMVVTGARARLPLGLLGCDSGIRWVSAPLFSHPAGPVRPGQLRAGCRAAGFSAAFHGPHRGAFFWQPPAGLGSAGQSRAPQRALTLAAVFHWSFSLQISTGPVRAALAFGRPRLAGACSGELRRSTGRIAATSSCLALRGRFVPSRPRRLTAGDPGVNLQRQQPPLGRHFQLQRAHRRAVHRQQLSGFGRDEPRQQSRASSTAPQR